jgi:fibronectin type 3 domain-containing protein
MAHSVSLSWIASTDVVDGYNVYRGPSAGSESTTPVNGATLVLGTTFVDSSVVEGSTYYYYATGVKGGVESLHSNEVQAVVLPAAPTNLAATVS